MPIKSALFEHNWRDRGIGRKIARKRKCGALDLIHLHSREAIQIGRALLQRIVRSCDVAEAASVDDAWRMWRSSICGSDSPHQSTGFTRGSSAVDIDKIQQNNSWKVP